jgi:hypothetical protein
MKRLRVLFAFGALTTSTVIVPIVLSSGTASAVAGPSVETFCPGTLTGTTFTLTRNCDTTVQLSVPDGHTLNGGGFAIHAHDVGGGTFFGGAVLTNDGTSMNITNLTVKGTGFATNCGVLGLYGILFNDASGSVSNAQVLDITEHSSCQVGTGIRANALNGTARNVTISNTLVSGYQKSALIASGMVTVNVTGSTLGPPDNLSGLIAQNGVQYGGVGPKAGAGGTIAGSTIYGSGYGNPANDGTAVLLYGAKDVTFSNDIITGDGTDVGVAVATDTVDNLPSTGVTISHNQIGRTAPDVPDTYGIGVQVDATKVSPDSLISAASAADPSSSATLICNTFSGWKTDIVGAVQGVCITTATLPDGTVGVPYSAMLTVTGGAPPYTWSLVSGSLPPGLALDANGTVSGTPTTEGIFDLTVKVTDSQGHTDTEAFPLTIVVSSPPPPPKTQGYWITAGDGGVFTFGSAAFHGSAATVPLVAPVVGIATTPNGVGYWLGAKDGGVFSYGVPFHGSLGNVHLAAPIVGIAATPDGLGYYLVGADGGVFTFGDAHFHGSLGDVHLAAPITGIAVTTDGEGYYLVGMDGGVFTFGDAHFQGSLGAAPPNAPVVGIAVDNATHGYWLVGANGSLYPFGAPSFGSVANVTLAAPIVGIAATQDGLGYRFVGSDGGLFCFGDAEFLGSLAKTALNKPAVGMTSIS